MGYLLLPSQQPGPGFFYLCLLINIAAPRHIYLNLYRVKSSKQNKIFDMDCSDEPWCRASISTAWRQYSEQCIEMQSLPCLQQVYWLQELRQHNILHYFKLCVESTLSQKRKREMKKLLCVISSSLWWILSNTTTFVRILCFLRNGFDAANMGRTSGQDYQRRWIVNYNIH